MKRSNSNNLNRSVVRKCLGGNEEVVRWQRSEGDDDPYVVETVHPTVHRRNTVGRSQGTSEAFQNSESGWYKVWIQIDVLNVKEIYTKECYMTELQRVIYPKKITPYCWKPGRKQAEFYVNDHEVALALASINCTIEQFDGHLLDLCVKPSKEPYFTVNDKLKGKMLDTIESRYNVHSNTLDLSKFYADEKLRDDYCPLYRPILMQAAIEMIVDRFPNLETLMLNNNNIRSLQYLSQLGERLPHLKKLYLSNNLLERSNSFDFIKDTNVVELVLIGNPIRKQYDGDETYINCIRRQFPQLQKLDERELPRQIRFDISDEDFKVPLPQFAFFVDSAGRTAVEDIVNHYFKYYDSNDRLPLASLYHEQAMFSITANYDKTKLAKYQARNRNLMRINDTNSRVGQLKHGKSEIISLLLQLPATNHVPASFAVDLMIYTQNLMMLTITGIFREEDDQHAFSLNQQYMRSFHRTFVIAAKQEGGGCIINDMLHVNRLTPAQERTANRYESNDSLTDSAFGEEMEQ